MEAVEKEKLEVDEEAAKRNLEAQDLQACLSEVNASYESLTVEYKNTERKSKEAATRLSVLSNYFKEREAKLQTELGEKEALSKRDRETSEMTDERIKLLTEEVRTYKKQVSDYKSIVQQMERDFRQQIAAKEKEAHESWVAARAAERDLKETKNEHQQLSLRVRKTEEETLPPPPMVPFIPHPPPHLAGPGPGPPPFLPRGFPSDPHMLPHPLPPPFFPGLPLPPNRFPGKESPSSSFSGSASASHLRPNFSFNSAVSSDLAIRSPPPLVTGPPPLQHAFPSPQQQAGSYGPPPPPPFGRINSNDQALQRHQQDALSPPRGSDLPPSVMSSHSLHPQQQQQPIFTAGSAGTPSPYGSSADLKMHPSHNHPSIHPSQPPQQHQYQPHPPPPSSGQQQLNASASSFQRQFDGPGLHGGHNKPNEVIHFPSGSVPPAPSGAPSSTPPRNPIISTSVETAADAWKHRLPMENSLADSSSYYNHDGSPVPPPMHPSGSYSHYDNNIRRNNSLEQVPARPDLGHIGGGERDSEPLSQNHIMSQSFTQPPLPPHQRQQLPPASQSQLPQHQPFFNSSQQQRQQRQQQHHHPSVPNEQNIIAYQNQLQPSSLAQQHSTTSANNSSSVTPLPPPPHHALYNNGGGGIVGKGPQRMTTTADMSFPPGTGGPSHVPGPGPPLPPLGYHHQQFQQLPQQQPQSVRPPHQFEPQTHTNHVR